MPQGDCTNTEGSIPSKLEVLFSRLKEVEQVRANEWKARCPHHDDKNPSLNVTVTGDKILVHCFAGCDPKDVLKDLNLGFSDLDLSRGQKYLRAQDDSSTSSRAPHSTHGRGLTLAELSGSKGLPVSFLQGLGLKEGTHYKRPCVLVPYRDITGQVVAVRKRLTMDGKDRFRWRPGDRVLPYGLEHLDNVRAEGWVLLVEGESDCWTCWLAGVPALGIPGKGTWQDEWASYVEGLDVYLWVEPDADDLIPKVGAKVPNLRIIRAKGIKDPSEAHILGLALPEWLDELRAKAELVGQPNKSTSTPHTALLETERLTDSVNAETIAELYGDVLRYDHLRAKWLIWQGHYWQADGDGQVCRWAKDAARERHKKALDIESLDARTRVSKWAVQSEQSHRLQAAILLAKNEPRIADDGRNWDSDPWLFGCANGVIDLRSGHLRDGRPEDRITMHSDVEFDSEAECPRFELFLNEVFESDEELVAYVRRLAGYTMTGHTSEQVWVLAQGAGMNGKSKFLSILRHVMGDYAYNAPFSTFEMSARSGIPNDVAALEGRRLVTSLETNESTVLNAARVKLLSGEDEVTARYLYHEHFTFRPVLKLWLAVNSLPRVNDDSYAFWRRVRLLPFNRRFVVGKDADSQLGEKLMAEASGVLNWLVRGCLEWQERGLEPTPPMVLAATQSYQQEEDPLAEFLESRCVVAPDAVVKACDLYAAYCDWTSTLGMGTQERLNLKGFGMRMGAKFKKPRSSGGVVYHGIRLRV